MIEKIIKRNSCKNELKISKEKLKAGFLIENIAENFEMFFLTPIAYGANIGKHVLYYPLYLIERLLLKIPTSTYIWISLPSFSIDTFDGNIIMGITEQRFLVTPFTAILVPSLYLAINIGKLAGALAALPFSLLLNPVGLIKSFYDTYHDRKRVNNNIAEKRAKFLKKEAKTNAAYEKADIESQFFMLNFKERLNLDIEMPIKNPEDIKKIYASFEEIYSSLLKPEHKKESEEFISGAIIFFEILRKIR